MEIFDDDISLELNKDMKETLNRKKMKGGLDVSKMFSFTRTPDSAKRLLNTSKEWEIARSDPNLVVIKGLRKHLCLGKK